MTKSRESCPICLKPLNNSGSGFVTRFIESCRCGQQPYAQPEDYEPVSVCQKCRKRVGNGRDGSLTQWIFQGDNCRCSKPEEGDRDLIVDSIPDQQADVAEEELDLSAAEFPLQRYKPLRILGQGFVGKVYLSRDRFLRTKVAIKVLQSVTPDSVVSFQREAKVMSTLNHPNIIQVLDFGITELSKPYMVMPCVEGLNVLELVGERGTLAVRVAVFIGTRVCQAIGYAHSKGIYHRDIKSENILVSRDRSGNLLDVFISDFGLALIDLNAQERTLFNGNTLVGTPQYMSPDQALGRTFDARSEIYSVGCVLFEMLAGHPPFTGTTAIETINMHAKCEVPRLPDVQEHQALKDELESVIRKSLEKDPENRYQSMSELEQALRSLDHSSFSFNSGTSGLDSDSASGGARGNRRPPTNEQELNKRRTTIRLSVAVGIFLTILCMVSPMNRQKSKTNLKDINSVSKEKKSGDAREPGPLLAEPKFDEMIDTKSPSNVLKLTYSGITDERLKQYADPRIITLDLRGNPVRTLAG